MRPGETNQMKPDVKLSTGRVIKHREEATGAHTAYSDDGKAMSGAEWAEYCVLVKASVVANPPATRAEQNRRALARDLAQKRFG